MARTTTGTSTQTATAEAARSVWDARGYYRKALAIVAPVPLAAMGVVYVVNDVPGGAPFEEVVAAVAGRTDLLLTMAWVSALFFALLIPAVLAVAAVTWRRVPRLTAIAVTLTVPGFATAFGVLPNDTALAILTHDLGLDVAAVGALDEAWWAQPLPSLAALVFLLGIVVGLTLLGIALWRSRLAPAWMGIALIVGGATHPFLPSTLAQGVGLLVGAVGLAGASLALVRMSNEEFAPTPR